VQYLKSSIVKSPMPNMVVQYFVRSILRSFNTVGVVVGVSIAFVGVFREACDLLVLV